MRDALRRRGPDAQGEWYSSDGCLGFGHRRLSIVELSDLGAQPMHSASGRFVMTYNGEIYNFPELKRSLDQLGHHFRGNSDTEVILASFEAWGIEGALQRFIGMFAMAVWSAADRSLHLIRDHAGVKPLYYGWLPGGGFGFASTLHAFEALPDISLELEDKALTEYLRFTYIPAPLSIYRGIYKLLPGTWLTLKEEELQQQVSSFSPVPRTGAGVHPRPYWQLAIIAAQGAQNLLHTERDVENAVEQALFQEVQRCMLADVPVGCFLSGGIDSALIAHCMKRVSSRVLSFSVGVDAVELDESADARKAAARIGTTHHEIFLNDLNAAQFLDDLNEAYDEPFADSSQLPTLAVSKLAASSVKVVLSGDGGDELFGGYLRYQEAIRLRQQTALLPPALRRLCAAGIRAVPPQLFDLMLRCARPLSARARRVSGDGQRLARYLERAIGAQDPFARYLEAMTAIDPESFIDPATISTLAEDPRLAQPHPSRFDERMMFSDTLTYFPDDLMSKTDRATMQYSIEGRIPFMNHPLIELAWRIPAEMKIRFGTTKPILRNLASRLISPDIAQKAKRGFGIPVEKWLRAQFKTKLDAAIHDKNALWRGFLKEKYVMNAWSRHAAGTENHQSQLWTLLMLERWAERRQQRTPPHRSNGN